MLRSLDFLPLLFPNKILHAFLISFIRAAFSRNTIYSWNSLLWPESLHHVT
jgi:hypothetical protein